jgi:hypothetical protein
MSILLDMIAMPFALKKLKAARAILNNVTPLKTDCGRLCDGACCKADDSGENGMLLYPFEDRFYRKPIEGFPFRLMDDDRLYKGGKRLVCEGKCPREHRPIACRVFPLRMKLVLDPSEDETRVDAELDPRAWAVCPLLEGGGLRTMAPAFRAAVQEAGTLLSRNVYMLEAMVAEQRVIDELKRL